MCRAGWLGSLPAGRPSEYDPAYCERVIALGKQGKGKGKGKAVMAHLLREAGVDG